MRRNVASPRMTPPAPERSPLGSRPTARQLAHRVVTSLAGDAVESATAAEDVRRVEVEKHINPGRSREGSHAETLVGLALSGGGIRSATFGLGVIQALRSLDVFKHLDYVSSVSGGGYLNGWLQAVTARQCVDQALPSDAAPSKDRQEPRQVRFLRAYSNYLTPKLGLFSGDTWAAVGISLRNLVLNLGVLSLSLVAPLYLPWLLTLGFWRLVPDEGSATLSLLFAGVLLATTMSISTLNMSQPLRDGSWNRPMGTQPPTWLVLVFVVLPALAGVGLISPLAWTMAVRDQLAPQHMLWVSLGGGAWYAFVWIAGGVGGFALGRARSAAATVAAPDWPKMLRAFGVLVGTAFVAGLAGTSVGALGTRWLQQAIDLDHTWLVWLLVFPTWVLAFLTAVTVHIGLAGRWLSDETREWWGRVTGVQLLVTLLVVIVSALSLAGPHVWEWRAFPGLTRHQESINTALAVLWAALTGTGILAGRSSRTSTGSGSLLERVGSIAPIVFVVGYLVLVATFLHHQVPHLGPRFSAAAMHDTLPTFTFDDVEDSLRDLVHAARNPERTGPLPPLPPYELSLLLMAVLFAGLAIGLSRRVDLNEFSLHALYRNRLVRCYLGASNPKRAAHPFTGFDPVDDVPLAAAVRADRDTPIRPYPLFNVAMNLVGGKNLAWQQRKAASFIFSPEYCGFEYRVDEDNEQERLARTNGNGRHDRRSAYARTREHGGDPRSLTLGLAVATSGAAASPNMGYHTSPTLSFLMTVFNVRLGWWLRNPRWTHTWGDGNARLSLKELLFELLGMTTDDRNWVYLSDGGHFENLGIYELVRRRCRFIIACDAGQDGAVTFEDLGNAIEKCRSDFGINIEIDLSRLRPQGDSRFSGSHCAIGTIRYDDIDRDDPPGTLLYIKSSLTGDEPADVLRYASAHPTFPHESTADQFFDESQFESYRALGYHIACATLTAAAGKDEMADMPAVELFTHLRQQWTVSAPVPPDAVRKYSAVLSDIWATVRTTEALQFLDAQMFPAWASLLVSGDIRGAAVARTEKPGPGSAEHWLPDTLESRRAGFYVCNQMLQLMEDVYIEFGLDEHYDHIDNRGWMNLFQHWAWSGMLTATWAITGSTFDPRFQRFCSRRLGLELGRPYIFMKEEYWLPTPADWKKDDFDRPRYVREWERGGARLNFFEVQLVDRFLHASEVTQSLQLMPIRVFVPSPRRDEHNLDFNVGYIIAHVDWHRKVFRLHHMRIQNHLRKMGLAGHTLRMVTASPQAKGWGLQLEIVEPEAVVTERVNVALDEALPSRSGARRLQRIVDSLR